MIKCKNLFVNKIKKDNTPQFIMISDGSTPMMKCVELLNTIYVTLLSSVKTRLIIQTIEKRKEKLFYINALKYWTKTMSTTAISAGLALSYKKPL